MKFSYFLICFLSPLLQFEAQHEHVEYAIEMDMDLSESNLDFSAYNIDVIRKVSALGNVYHLRYVNTCQASRCKRDVSNSILQFLKDHPLIHRVEEQEELEVEQKLLDPDLEYFYDDRELNSDFQKKFLEKLEDDYSTDLDEETEVEKKPFSDKETKSHESIPENKISLSGIKKGENIQKPNTKDDEEYLELVNQRQKRLKEFTFNDPETSNMWQYHNHGQFDQVNPGLDMNLFNIYKNNITGRGVVVTVIDDGLDTKNTETKKNFDPSASLDLNDPHNLISNPRGSNYYKTVPLKNGHGTLCGSAVAGEANNGICAFGVAYNANLGGIRMLAKNMVTDLLEAFALTHNNQYIDIYSNSWGPKDSGEKTSPTTHYVKKALLTGVTKGRNGKGSIYLFAAGNGGSNSDHCGADGFVNSPYTIASTATNIYGMKPAYTEECSAISITAAVGGRTKFSISQMQSINPTLISSHVNNKCHKHFVGTSAATPLIAGCIALALEVNSNLNWRDIQYLFTISARIPNPTESVWQINSAGLLISHLYGFGLLDCTAFVRNAQMWTSVGELRICVGGTSDLNKPLKIKSRKRTRVAFQTSACENTENAISLLEHVVIHTKIKHACRGDLAITLTSPTNTTSVLLKNRYKDKNNQTISFSFLSLMHWGEKPQGTWLLDVVDIGECTQPDISETGSILEVSLHFHGTSESNHGIFRNKRMFQSYFKNIKIVPPKTSIILDNKDIYNYYNNQRKYFIQLNTLHREVINYKNKIKNSKSKDDTEILRKKLILLKNKASEDEIEFLNSLLNNTKA